MGSIKQKILEYMRRPGYQPMKPRKLARQIGIGKKERVRFEDLVETLISKSKIKRSEDGFLVLQGQSSDRVSGLIAGTLRRTASGSAWLIPEQPSVQHSEPSFNPAKPIQDVFIYPEHLADAQNGDHVLVRLTGKRRSGNKPCGRVEQIIERSTHTFVGTYFEEWEQGKVRIDGGVLSEPISVGDPGAKGVTPGDKVVVEMVRFPTHAQPGEAVLTQILGARGEPGVDELAIVHEFGLPDVFSEEVLQEARERGDAFDESIPEGRVDLTGETIVTIDPADARDFDDAISLTRSDDGHWHLGVHIADVAHFVAEDGELDREAHRRGTSIYLPGRVIPMLPETISNSLASLQQGRIRFTKSVFIEFSPEGVPVHTSFQNTAIKVTRRFAYEHVLPIVNEPEKFQKKVSAAVRQLLGRMHELAMMLRNRRFDHGAIELHLPEVKVELDKDGRVTGAKAVEHDESHQIIEEFMLAANCAVARELTDREIMFLRRVHGNPDPVKLNAFRDFVDSLGFTLENPADRFEQQKLLKQIQGKPVEQAVNFALLRSMKQAEYSGADLGHYALSVDQYCHFTSPIRRYPDLTVHRLIDQIVKGKKKTIGRSEVETIKLGTHCSATERRAAQAERQLTRFKLLSFLEQQKDEVFDAVITGVEKFGIFCRCQKYPVDGFIHVSVLSGGEYVDYDRATHTMTGRSSGRIFRMGDLVQVKVALVDPDERTLHWELVGSSSRSTSKQRPPARRKAGKKSARRTTFERPKPRKRPTQKKAGRKRKR